MHVLNVAEKPSIAKSISNLLSRQVETVNSMLTMQRNGKNKFCKNYDFECQINGTLCSMTMTSVLGHLISHDFPTEYNDWKSVPPENLFNAPINKFVTPVWSVVNFIGYGLHQAEFRDGSKKMPDAHYLDRLR